MIKNYNTTLSVFRSAYNMAEELIEEDILSVDDATNLKQMLQKIEIAKADAIVQNAKKEVVLAEIEMAKAEGKEVFINFGTEGVYPYNRNKCTHKQSSCISGNGGSACGELDCKFNDTTIDRVFFDEFGIEKEDRKLLKELEGI